MMVRLICGLSLNARSIYLTPVNDCIPFSANGVAAAIIDARGLISKRVVTPAGKAFQALPGFALIFPDTCYHLTHYWLAAVDIPVASDNPVHYTDAIRYNARMPLQGSLLPLTRLGLGMTLM